MNIRTICFALATALAACPILANAQAADQTAKPKAPAAKAKPQEPCCEEMKTAATKVAQAEECCKSTADKPVAKGAPGCCNEPGQAAKFKVFVAGAGYKFFGCEESAKKGRDAIVAKGGKVGIVQKVLTRVKVD